MHTNWNYLKRMAGVVNEMAQTSHDYGYIAKVMVPWDENDEDFVQQATRTGKYEPRPDDGIDYTKEPYKPVKRKLAIQNRYTTLLQQKNGEDVGNGEREIIFTVGKNKIQAVRLKTHYEELVSKLQQLGLDHVAEHGLTMNPRKEQEDPELAKKPKDSMDYIDEVFPLNDTKNIDSKKYFMVNEKLPKIPGVGKDFDWKIGEKLLNNEPIKIDQSLLSGKTSSEVDKIFENYMKEKVKTKAEEWAKTASETGLIPKDYYNKFIREKEEIYKDLFRDITWRHRAYDKMTAEDIVSMASVLLTGMIHCLLSGQNPDKDNKDNYQLFSGTGRGSLAMGFNSYYSRHILGINTADKTTRQAQTGHHGSADLGAGSIDTTSSDKNKSSMASLQKGERITAATPEEKKEAKAQFSYNDPRGQSAINMVIDKIANNKTLSDPEEKAIIAVIEKYDKPQLRTIHGFPDDKWKILMNSHYVDKAFQDEEDLVAKEHFRLAGITPNQTPISFNEDTLIPHWRVRNQMVNEIGGATTGPGATHDTANYQVEGDPTGKMARQLGHSTNSMLLNDDKKKTHRRRYKKY